MTIKDGRICFLGENNYQHKRDFPPTLRLIRSLKIYITFRRWHRKARGHGPYPSPTKTVVSALLAAGNYALRNLEVRISGSIDEAKSFFGNGVRGEGCKSGLLLADLEWNLAPLRALRGVKLSWTETLLGGERGDDWGFGALKKVLSPLKEEGIKEQQRALEGVLDTFMRDLACEVA
jgi:hypothetical protein